MFVSEVFIFQPMSMEQNPSRKLRCSRQESLQNSGTRRGSLSIATRLQAGRPQNRGSTGQRFFLYHCVQTGSGAHTVSKLAPESLYPAADMKHEADQSCLSSAEDKNIRVS